LRLKRVVLAEKVDGQRCCITWLQYVFEGPDLTWNNSGKIGHLTKKWKVVVVVVVLVALKC